MISAERKAAIVESRGPYTSWVAQAFTKEIGAPRPYDPPVVDPLTDELPNEIRIRKKTQALGSLLELNSRLLAADDRLKGIIERLDPGVHRFWPLKIVMPRGIDYPAPYFGMLIGRFLDSFSPEQSDPEAFQASRGLFHVSIDQKAVFARLAYSGHLIGSAHLWRERRMLTPEVMMSDELQAAIGEAGLRLPKHFKVSVI